MSKLSTIRYKLDLVNRQLALADIIQPQIVERWYADDVALLLQIADAALAYEEATQIPDGVRQAERDLFSTLAPLKEAV